MIPANTWPKSYWCLSLQRPQRSSPQYEVLTRHYNELDGPDLDISNFRCSLAKSSQLRGEAARVYHAMSVVRRLTSFEVLVTLALSSYVDTKEHHMCRRRLDGLNFHREGQIEFIAGRQAVGISLEVYT